MHFKTVQNKVSCY